MDSRGRALFTNRLSLEKSPYLLQHAHNPINWLPWSEQVFERAKKENLPVLLSVGYSACHWCHVMEEESFEDTEIAEYINRNYIAVKVDKEERPDIDSVYMRSVQMMTGRGGWPMTLWLSPDKTPFFGGTYFPPRTGDRGASIGFLPLLKELKKVFDEKQEDISKGGAEMREALKKSLIPDRPLNTVPGAEVFQTALRLMEKQWDLFYGGMRGAPKFPSSFPLRFLLRSYTKTRDEKTRHALRVFLTGMERGGLQDHIDGGFHRYSTDEKWLVPHFEKMLYDQALLAGAYTEAFQLLKEASYKQTAGDILNYVIRDMSAPQGGFYSAVDADSPSPEGDMKEGRFQTWTLREVDQALDKPSADLVKEYYGMTKEGNFEGRNILFIPADLPRTAEKLQISLQAAKKRLSTARKTLYQARERRPAPLRDEKVLAGWNGLMISAFVSAGSAFNNKKFLRRGEEAALFILNNMQKQGELFRCWREGTAYGSACLEDYVFFISALLDLFEGTGNIRWLKSAVAFDQVVERDFEDREKGGFFMTTRKKPLLIAREKNFFDGAEPSGNSVSIRNLLRLAGLTGKTSYEKRAEKTLKACGSTLKNHPLSFSELLVSLDFYLNRGPEIVLIFPKGSQWNSDPLFNELKKRFLPRKTLITARDLEEEEEKNRLIPAVRRKTAVDGKTTAYICKEGACFPPANNLSELKKQLKEITREPLQPEGSAT